MPSTNRVALARTASNLPMTFPRFAIERETFVQPDHDLWFFEVDPEAMAGREVLDERRVVPAGYRSLTRRYPRSISWNNWNNFRDVCKFSCSQIGFQGSKELCDAV